LIALIACTNDDLPYRTSRDAYGLVRTQTIERTRTEYRRTQLSALISKNREAARAVMAQLDEE
jgi:hypothetical protein